MLSFAILITLLTLSTVASYVWMERNDLSNLAILSFTISTLALLSLLMPLPFMYYGGLAEVERYHALKESYEESRSQDLSEYERATIAQKIAEYNADIASKRYWNDTIFDIYIPDELAELEYLK